VADAKLQAAARRVAAVNADGRFGEWRYALCRDMNKVPQVIEEAVG